jgi:aminoglycoside/choline kinase family phosphotransferase
MVEKKREQDLLAWSAQQLADQGWSCPAELSLQSLNGDAGFRRYFRLNCEPSLLAVDAPVDHEDSEAFVAIARYLRGQSVRTPQIIATDFQRGFLLVEDFGDRLYRDELLLDDSRASQLYGDALLTLLRLQQCPLEAIPAADGESLLTLPDYSQQRLRDEMSLFHEWFLPQLLGYVLSDDERQVLDALYRRLEEVALQQPQVWVHRDYHSRNLIYRDGKAPGVIDFQDAVRGPITYDLVSLLRDCYLRWSPSQVEKWALTYGDMAVECGLMPPVTQTDFLRWFDWMGLQRHLKVLGIFSRLYLRDGKAGYLADIPLVIRYTVEVADKYPELSDFSSWFREKILPLCDSHRWYDDFQLAGERGSIDGEQPTVV